MISLIVYTKSLGEFCYDVDLGIIAEEIQNQLIAKGFNHSNISEYRAWSNSLLHMKNVLDTDGMPKDTHVAIEYNIPNTSKRVDFIVTGLDENNNPNVIIIELKQWEKAERASRKDLITTYLGQGIRTLPHPSYQAYSYAKTIEHYNEYVGNNDINLIPTAYLHNYKEEYRSEIDNDLYKHIIIEAPLFLQRDTINLRNFIKKYIKKTDHGKLLYEIDHGRIKPSKALQDSISSMLKGNQEFYMIDEQKVAFETIRKLVDKSMYNDEKYTIIIEGGPGTGKSVIAINLLAHYKDKMVNYVTKNAAPRNVFFSKLRRENYKLNYIKNLFKGSGAYVNSRKNEFDLLIVDEAHRLNKKSGLFSNLGENQIKEIINASKVSVFFIDEDQIVTTKDFGSVDEIKKQANLLGSKIFHGDDYNLISQFRCNGSNGYLDFLDTILNIRKTAIFDTFYNEYDFRVYDDINKMYNDLLQKNQINNKARLIAGYGYEWITKNKPNDPDLFDIEIGDFKAKWNFNNTQTWAIDEDSFDQVGCIHTSQGLEFDYVGIIIAKDLYYDAGVKTDYNKRANTDQSLKGIKSTNDFEFADRIIRNTYKTLLSRGQKGCYVFAEDKALSDYFKKEFRCINKLN